MIRTAHTAGCGVSERHGGCWREYDNDARCYISLVSSVSIAAGARPLLPRRLTYPEILQPLGPAAGDFLYEGGAKVLARRIEDLAGRMARGDFWRADPSRLIRAVARFHWDARAEAMDRALE